MSTSHHRVSTGGARELRLALGLTAAIMVVEGVAGWWSGSLALLADAGHMLADAAALAFSLFAAWIATRPATSAKTYGYYRTEILAALGNGLALWLLVMGIYVGAWHRLQRPAAIDSNLMMVVASAGLLANLASGWILRRVRTASLNVEGAWLNVMSDALGSIGVLLAGALVHRYGWTAADPLASMAIGVLIALNAWNLVKQSVNILLEGAPGHLQMPDVIQAMRSVPGIHEVHDLHCWTITTGMDAMSGHVIIDDVAQSADILDRLNTLLFQRFGVAHTTFQLEPRGHVCRMGAAAEEG